jgi:hypothetical protein
MERWGPIGAADEEYDNLHLNVMVDDLAPDCSDQD